MNSIKASLKMLAFALLCVPIIPTQLLILAFHKDRAAYIIPRLFHKGVCAIFGVKIQKIGTPYTDSQVIYMSNHISYLDISAIGGIIPYASFVAKKDVSGWPVFGFLSTLQQTAFISRDRNDARKEANALDTMLQAGKNLTIFPEGTSTDGLDVVPFKSSLFSLAYQDGLDDIVIQPVTIRVLSANKKPVVTQDDRDIYSWHVNMDTELHDHLWAFAKRSGAVLEITFHDVIPARDCKNRKVLAKACYEAVCSGLKISKAA